MLVRAARINFEMALKTNLMLAVILGVTASTLGKPTGSVRLYFNSSRPIENNRLLRPINIPDLPNFSNNRFRPTPSLSAAQNIKDSNNKSKNYFTRKTIHPEERRESLSQETISEPKYSSGRSPTSDSSLKFSSKYSTTTDVYKGVQETAKSSEELKGVKEDEVNQVAESTEISDLLDDNKGRFQSGIIPSSDEKYKTYSDSYPTHSYFEDLEEDRADIRHYSDVNEPRDAEESEVSTTTSEPYRELRDPTSFQNSRYAKDDFENDETSLGTVEDSEEEEKEEKRSADDYHDFGSKNYHSVQTPLKEIKFRPPHSVKDSYEYDTIRTRLSPIRRHPVSHNWPYSRAQIKEEAEKLNEILDSDEKEDSDEWKSEEINTKSKLRGLEKAIEKDQSKQSVSKKHHYNTDKNRKIEKQNALSAVEAKDHASPFFQTLKQYKVADEEEELVQPTVAYKGKPKPSIKTERIRSTSSTLSKQKTPFQKLFTDQTINNFKTFNTTKELIPNFQGHQFLGPIAFNKNIEELKATTEKPNSKFLQQKEKNRNIFLEDLEKKETVDQQNLTKEKFQQTILGITNNNEIPSQSFNYQEDSDEMYNQILANIQSIFGVRTKSLKTEGGKKSSSDSQKEAVDEDKLLTWSVPLKKRESSKQETVKNVVAKENQKKVKGGSDVENSFSKSIFSSDILQS